MLWREIGEFVMTAFGYVFAAIGVILICWILLKWMSGGTIGQKDE